MFVIEDLIVGAFGVEIVGAYLLARGLLTSARSIAMRATTRGFDAPGAVSDVEDRVDASYGLACIGLGLCFQVTGLLLVLGSGSTVVGRSWEAIGTAVGVLLTGVGVAYAGHRFTRARRVKRLLVEISRLELYGDKALDHPQAPLLRWLGETFGEPARDGESDKDYCRRVFEVDQFDRSFKPTPVASGPLAPHVGQGMSDRAIGEALNREFRRRGAI